MTDGPDPAVMAGGPDPAREAGPRDRAHLERACELARRGWGRVHPNPMVGCVIARGEGIVGEGWHAEFGGPHAEIVALAEAGANARGATAYVSLEPCAHHGKTPPCTDALVDAGVTRVVYGAADPGGESGGGGARLRERGLEVIGPIHPSTRARRENPAFFHDDPSRPWTVLKLAVSIDGAVSRRAGAPTALSGPEAWERTHRLRAGVDAILVGAGTVRADRPRLTVRGDVVPRRPPVRVILDPGADCLRALVEEAERSPPRPGALADPGAPPVWVAVGPSIPPLPEPFRRLPVTERPDGRLDPGALFTTLRAEGIERVLCEGGPTWARSLLQADLVDRLVLVTAPRTLGPDAVPAFPFPESSWQRAGEPEGLGGDVWCEWDRLRRDQSPTDRGRPAADRDRAPTDQPPTDQEA